MSETQTLTPESIRKIVASKMRELADEVDAGTMEPDLHYYGPTGQYTINMTPTKFTISRTR